MTDGRIRVRSASSSTAEAEPRRGPRRGHRRSTVAVTAARGEWHRFCPRLRDRRDRLPACAPCCIARADRSVVASMMSDTLPADGSRRGRPVPSAPEVPRPRAAALSARRLGDRLDSARSPIGARAGSSARSVISSRRAAGVPPSDERRVRAGSGRPARPHLRRHAPAQPAARSGTTRAASGRAVIGPSVLTRRLGIDCRPHRGEVALLLGTRRARVVGTARVVDRQPPPDR